MEKEQQASNEELANTNTVDSNEGQTTEQKEEGQLNEDAKRLRDEFTQARQREINLAIKLAERDKKSILDLDRETQNKVVKELYWLNNLEEVKLIHWDNFYSKQDWDEEESDDRLAQLEREIKLSKYQREKQEIDSAIDELRRENPLAFEDSEVELKIKEELQYVSDKLPPKERVRRAASMFVVDRDSIWRSIKETGRATWTIKTETKETPVDSEVQTEIASIFKRR